MSQFLKTREDIEAWLDDMRVRSYTVNEDLTVDVDGSVDISSRNLKLIPVRFRSVGGDFICWTNRLITLEGCPQIVDGHFECQNNRLRSLEGCPRRVGRSFFCASNDLLSLRDGPETVGEMFLCGGNPELGSLQEFRDWNKIKIVLLRQEMEASLASSEHKTLRLKI